MTGSAPTLAQAENAEAARCRAMAAGDLAALDFLLHPELRYGHTGGLWDTKAEYLAKLGDGRLIYPAASSTVTGHVTTGPATLLWVEVDAEVIVPAGRRTMRNASLTVWVLREGRAQMIAHQPTVLPVRE